MKVPQSYQKISTKIFDRKFLIGIPQVNPTIWDWYRMPLDVYTHKKYPTCDKCKEKYVPIDNKCFKCLFTT